MKAINETGKVMKELSRELFELIRCGSWNEAYRRCEEIEASLYDLKSEINRRQQKTNV